MKKWLIERFLPMWAKESVLRENRALRRQVRALEQALETQRAYIRGLEKGVRNVKCIMQNAK